MYDIDVTKNVGNTGNGSEWRFCISGYEIA